MNIIKKYRVLITFVILFIIFAAAKPGPVSASAAPVALKGVIDLSEWDFAQSGSIALDGEWEFYPNKLLLSKDVTSGNHKPLFCLVPGNWKTYKVGNRDFSVHNYGTFRLRVILGSIESQNKRFYGLKINRIFTAFKFLNNDDFVIKSGEVHSTKAGSRGRISGKVVFVKPEKGVLDFIFQVSNFNFYRGGLIEEIVLGTPENISAEYRNSLIFGIIFASFIFIMALYHIILFLFRKKEKAPLYFAFFSFLMFFQQLFEYETIMSNLFSGMNHVFEESAQTIVIFFIIPAVFAHLYYFFEKKFSLFVLRLLTIISVVFSIVLLIAPYEYWWLIWRSYEVVIVCGMIYAGYFIISIVIKKEPYALIACFGLLFLILSGGSDILIDLEVIKMQTAITFLPLGWFIFFFSHAVMIALKSSRAFSTIEELHGSLESKVEERTLELKTAVLEMRSMNKELVNANKKLEWTQNIAELDMTMAIHVQEDLLPAAVPKSDTWEAAYFFKPMTGVSGDFYDFYVIDDEFRGVSLFDVSGHGIASALLTMIAKSVVHQHFSGMQHETLNRVLGKVNSDLVKEIGSIDSFITGIILRLKDGAIEYVNAGHEDLVKKSARDGSVSVVNNERHNLRGYFLGVEDLEGIYKSMEFPMEKGDTVLLYSDCLVDSMNSSKKWYGIDRLLRSLERAPAGSCGEILEFILRDFYTFLGRNSGFHDDLTVIVLKRK
ncbi:MAG: SpoIIE family protein phosphatase [bacterium]|nr:SpoIIE family protein phosphatase [bacterium]